jgi:uncharacterized repeat protein (TIGR04138 family)
MKVDFAGRYQEMLSQEESHFPPQALKYILVWVKGLADRNAEKLLHPPGIVKAFEEKIAADFGPFSPHVLQEWRMESPLEFGQALHQLGKHDCLLLSEEDSLDRFLPTRWEKFFKPTPL